MHARSADEIDVYTKERGSLKDLRKRIEDSGLKVADVIGFAEWIVEDPDRRKKGLEQAKRDMDWAAQIGSPRIAAPPVVSRSPILDSPSWPV